MKRLSVHISINQDVFLTWIDDSSSGTLTLTPEEAISIGEVGEMAKLRKEAENDSGSSDGKS